MLSRIPTSSVVLVGTLFTVFLTYMTWRVLQNEDQRRFDEIVESIETPIQFRITRYQNLLVQTRAYFLSKNNRVSQKDFEAYLSQTALIENYPGIQGLGYALRLNRETNLKPDGSFMYMGQSYKLWPFNQQENEHVSIVYLFPNDWRNKRALGFDMFSSEGRRKAMSTARDTGQPALSGKVTLVQETTENSQPGCLLYVPLYQPGTSLATVEERRKNLVGFIYAPFRAYDFMSTIVSKGTKEIDYQIYSDSESADNVLYESYEKSPLNSDFLRRRELFHNGQKFILVVKSLPHFVTPLRKFLQSLIWIRLFKILLMLQHKFRGRNLELFFTMSLISRESPTLCIQSRACPKKVFPVFLYLETQRSLIRLLQIRELFAAMI